jgi:hypothetical protein
MVYPPLEASEYTDPGYAEVCALQTGWMHVCKIDAGLL